MRGAVVNLVAVLAVLLSGCAGRFYWNATVAQAPTVVVQPTSVYVSGPRLYIRATVLNRGPAPITVNRDAVALALPDGRILGRSVGVWTRHDAYVVLPGAARDVHVDFFENGFTWDQIPGAHVIWSSAIAQVGGGPIAVPPMRVTP
jgi:hypothetical protein